MAKSLTIGLLVIFSIFLSTVSSNNVLSDSSSVEKNDQEITSTDLQVDATHGHGHYHDGHHSGHSHWGKHGGKYLST